MNLSYSIDVYEVGAAATLYSVTFSDRDKCEFDRFCDDPECNSCPEFGDLMAHLDVIVSERGFDRAYKSRGYVPSLGYPIYRHPPQMLRLYCAAPRSRFAIVGGGCVKPMGGPLKQFPKCHDPHERLKRVILDLDVKLARGMIEYSTSGIEADVPITGAIKL